MVITSDLTPALSSRRGRIISASLNIHVRNLPAPIRKAKSGRQAFPPHEARSSRREEAPSEIHKIESEPPHVGCYDSRVQCANVSGNSLPGGERTRVRASVQPFESSFYNRGDFDYFGRVNG